jgi:myo-inositol-1(or 4)-monophosphatase
VPFDASQLKELRTSAEAAAAAGGAVILRNVAAAGGAFETKGRGDYVTATDREAEDAVRAVLADRTPEIPFVGEESGGERGDVYWAVDPVDGTTNLLRGFPVVATSVGLVEHRAAVVGAVDAPLLSLRFSAAKGQGAWSDDRRLQVSERPARQAIVAFAIPFRDRSLAPRYRQVLDRVWDATEDLRETGSAALDLSWIAAGVFDGYFEMNLGVWDVAAGAILITEAGGLMTDWSGGDDYLSGTILAGSTNTHALLLAAANTP